MTVTPDDKHNVLSSVVCIGLYTFRNRNSFYAGIFMVFNVVPIQLGTNMAVVTPGVWWLLMILSARFFKILTYTIFKKGR